MMARTSRIVRTRTGSYLDGELPKLQERHAAKPLELRTFDKAAAPAWSGDERKRFAGAHPVLAGLDSTQYTHT